MLKVRSGQGLIRPVTCPHACEYALQLTLVRLCIQPSGKIKASFSNRQCTYTQCERALMSMLQIQTMEGQCTQSFVEHKSYSGSVHGCWVPGDSTHESTENGGLLVDK